MNRAPHTPLPTVPGAVLTDIDTMTQIAVRQIAALFQVGRQVLAPDLDTLCHVRQLFTLVENLALELDNAINSEAERYGCHWTDKADRAFTDRISAQIEAARQATGGAA